METPELPEAQRVVMDELSGTHCCVFDQIRVTMQYGSINPVTGCRIPNPNIPLELQVE